MKVSKKRVQYIKDNRKNPKLKKSLNNAFKQDLEEFYKEHERVKNIKFTKNENGITEIIWQSQSFYEMNGNEII